MADGMEEPLDGNEILARFRTSINASTFDERENIKARMKLSGANRQIGSHLYISLSSPF
jgi:hypothetical protein